MSLGVISMPIASPPSRVAMTLVLVRSQVAALGVVRDPELVIGPRGILADHRHAAVPRAHGIGDDRPADPVVDPRLQLDPIVGEPGELVAHARIGRVGHGLPRQGDVLQPGAPPDGPGVAALALLRPVEGEVTLGAPPRPDVGRGLGRSGLVPEASRQGQHRVGHVVTVELQAHPAHQPGGLAVDRGRNRRSTRRVPPGHPRAAGAPRPHRPAGRSPAGAARPASRRPPESPWTGRPRDP